MATLRITSLSSLRRRFRFPGLESGAKRELRVRGCVVGLIKMYTICVGAKIHIDKQRQVTVLVFLRTGCVYLGFHSETLG